MTTTADLSPDALADAPPRARGMMLVWAQTRALTVDAYRDLNSRALFWIVLILSALAAAACLAIGFGPKGISVFGKQLFPLPNTNTMAAADFYKGLFINAGVKFWITWAATILALISTAGIIPDLITGGSVDLYLSKPVGRLRLFLTKYLLGLLFVALQITVFCAASFLVIGIRGGAWVPSIFLAVPVVTLYYSFLFCITALVGLLTGSTLTAVLVTLLIWICLFMLNLSDSLLLGFKTAWAVDAQGYESRIDRNEKQIAGWDAAPDRAPGEIYQGMIRSSLEMDQRTLADRQGTLRQLQFWHGLVLAAKAPLPKTSESIDILNRWLLDSELTETTPVTVDEPLTQPDLPDLQAGEPTTGPAKGNRRDNRRGSRPPPSSPFEAMDSQAVQTNIKASYGNRGPLWAFGTSLGFEAVVLGFACWRFARRDF